MRPGEDAAELADVLRDVVCSEPQRVWLGTELAEASGAPIVDVMVALAVMCWRGDLERVEPGRYRAPTRPAEQLVAELRLQIGDRAPVEKAS
jgi:hypothetical protein